jgi:spoIIIJ-associated protein
MLLGGGEAWFRRKKPSQLAKIKSIRSVSLWLRGHLQRVKPSRPILSYLVLRRKDLTMEELEISARTVEEAIQQALDKLGVDRDEVEVDVLSEGKSGILGLGTEEARVRVRPLVPMPPEAEFQPGEDRDLAERAKGILEALLAAMGIEASVEAQSQPPAEGEEDIEVPVILDIRGEDLGILIGRRGQTLACLQYVLRLIIAHQMKAWVPITIDVEGYKQRRNEALRNLAWRVAEEVRVKKRSFTLEPMPAYDRRIIHLTLADHPDVTTESTGEGEARKVVIVRRKTQRRSK